MNEDHCVIVIRVRLWYNIAGMVTSRAVLLFGIGMIRKVTPCRASFFVIIQDIDNCVYILYIVIEDPGRRPRINTVGWRASLIS